MRLRKRSLIIIGITILVIVIGGFLLLRRNKKPLAETIIAKRVDLREEVSVTGRVEPATSAELAFERSGKVARVFAKVGDTVSAGTTLVVLDNAELSAQVAQAAAGVATVQADLDALRKGTRPEEVQIAETKKTNAEKSLLDAQANLTNVQAKATIDLANLYNDVRDVLQDAFIKTDDALNKQIDDLFTNDASANPSLTFTAEAQSKIDVEAQRVTAQNTLVTFKADLAFLLSEQLDADRALQNAARYGNSIRDFLVRLQDALNTAVGLSSTTLATYKASVNTGRTNMNTALAAINTKQQAIALQKATNQSAISSAEAKVNDAKNALATADSELLLKRASATQEQIAAKEAQKESASANLAYVRAQLAKTVLVAPMSGVITKQDAKAGEIVAPNVLVVVLIAQSQFKIEAQVPEADIAKIHLRDKANVTLDAYGSGVAFPVTIVSVDPAETIIEGVSTYKTTLQFEENDARVKSGMTANIDVLVGKRDQVVALPQRALFTKEGKKMVRVRANDGTTRDVAVVTGLKGSDGMVEITEGVAEGDVVVINVQ
ncbi:efflux RND transporter periplasmic adaptor subunit [Candidatus Uhrbacteria bacterium]|nr:efflux RND transporter periplasmic adaptor subunit [Candidatus Uhrbacteria bacterium]